MKKLFFLLPLFGVMGCSNNCHYLSKDASCQAQIIAGAVVLAPIYIPVVLIDNSLESVRHKAYERQRYTEMKQGVEADNYEQIKQCVLYCQSGYTDVPYYDTQIQEIASRKLLNHTPDCIKNEEYSTYLKAYLNLIDKQRKTQQRPDATLLESAWTLYNKTAKIEHDTRTAKKCTLLSDNKIQYSIQRNIKYSLLEYPLQRLKADLFIHRQLQNIREEEVSPLFHQCPQLMVKDSYDKPYEIVSYCRTAYRHYYGLNKNDESPTLEAYAKQWKAQVSDK